MKPYIRHRKENREDFKIENIQYFEVKDAKFAKFYFLPKTNKQLYDVSGRAISFNCGYYLKNNYTF